MRAQLEKRRANGHSLPTKTEYFDAINVEEFEWKPSLKCSRYKFGRHIIKVLKLFGNEFFGNLFFLRPDLLLYYGQNMCNQTI